MKRDMDLIRRILLRIEEKDDGRGDEAQVEFPDVDKSLLYGHLKLLDEAHLIEGLDSQTIGASFYVPQRLTWEGHEFLDTIRDPRIWSDTKKKLSEVSGATSLEVIKSVAVSLTKLALGIQ